MARIFRKANLIKILLLITVGFAIGCGDEKPQKPKDLLDEQMMANVLVDVHILEAQLEKKVMHIDSLVVFIEGNYSHLFKQHKVSKDDFHRTFQYYEANPQEMDALYQLVINELTKREAELQGKVAK